MLADPPVTYNSIVAVNLGSIFPVDSGSGNRRKLNVEGESYCWWRPR